MNNTTNSINNLWGNTINHLSWIGSIFGLLLQIFILYTICKKINLNVYVKAIYCILCCHYIISHLLTFVSFIPILYLNSENFFWCAILRYFATSNGLWIQSQSALISVLRFYMGWCTSQNRIYKPWILVSLIITMTVVNLTITVTLNIFFQKDYCIDTVLNADKNSFVMQFGLHTLVVYTLCGISADILMYRMLRKMKNFHGPGTQLIPWVSNSQNKHYDGIIPRNSTIISTGIMALAGFWFAFAETMSGTLLLYITFSFVIIPAMLKFTISSKLSEKNSNVVLPKGLQFHEESNANIGN